MNNREKLIDMMIDYQLERREMAELLSVTLETVGHWLLPHGSSGHEEVPEMAIELLTLKLASREKPAPQ